MFSNIVFVFIVFSLVLCYPAHDQLPFASELVTIFSSKFDVSLLLLTESLLYMLLLLVTGHVFHTSNCVVVHSIAGVLVPAVFCYHLLLENLLPSVGCISMFLPRLTQNVRIESCDTEDTWRKNHNCNQVIVSEIPWSWLRVVVVISAVYLLGTRTEMSFLCGVGTHVY